MRARTFGLGLLVVLAAAAAPLGAGDLATFVNLGFSAAGSRFMFGQYGVSEPGSTPYANVAIVDVGRNDFVPNGVSTLTGERLVGAGDPGDGALYSLLELGLDAIRTHEIDHQRKGRLIYILLNGEEPPEALDFRDFESGIRYQVRLSQEQRGSGTSVSAAFHLDVTATPGTGAPKTFQVGLVDYFRDGVREYRVRRVVLAPDNRSLVFVIERTEKDNNVRFMVETASP